MNKILVELKEWLKFIGLLCGTGYVIAAVMLVPLVTLSAKSFDFEFLQVFALGGGLFTFALFWYSFVKATEDC